MGKTRTLRGARGLGKPRSGVLRSPPALPDRLFHYKQKIAPTPVCHELGGDCCRVTAPPRSAATIDPRSSRALVVSAPQPKTKPDMSDNNPSDSAPVPAPVETPAAPTAAVALDGFGSSRGTGLARGKRPARPVRTPAGSTPAGSQPTAIQVVGAKTE